jgi:hypothetical protein
MVGLEDTVPMAVYTCVLLFQGSLTTWCKITVYTCLYTVVMHLAPGHPPPLEARVRSQASPYGICVEQSGTAETVYLRLP